MPRRVHLVGPAIEARRASPRALTCERPPPAEDDPCVAPDQSLFAGDFCAALSSHILLAALYASRHATAAPLKMFAGTPEASRSLEVSRQGDEPADQKVLHDGKLGEDLGLVHLDHALVHLHHWERKAGG